MDNLIYVNMDEKFIPTHKLSFAKISEDELKIRLREAFLSECYAKDLNYAYIDFKESYFFDIINFLPIVRQDLDRISFSEENHLIESFLDNDEGNLFGFHTLENGLTFIGCMNGGDWECPLFLLYYYDGRDIRGYIPSYGNTLNLDAKTAFGSEGNIVSKEKLKTLYSADILQKTKYISNDEFDDEDYDFTAAYILNQNIEYDWTMEDDLHPNWEAIKKELLTVFNPL